jgi:hypothetical protein
MCDLFITGYYYYWEGKDYTECSTKEEQRGFLTAAYEVATGIYKEHRVFSNLGICVMP